MKKKIKTRKKKKSSFFGLKVGKTNFFWEKQVFWALVKKGGTHQQKNSREHTEVPRDVLRMYIGTKTTEYIYI